MYCLKMLIIVLRKLAKLRARVVDTPHHVPVTPVARVARVRLELKGRGNISIRGDENAHGGTATRFSVRGSGRKVR
jgi:hypothetical protein